MASFETAVYGLDNSTISAQDRALRNGFIIVSDFVCLSAALGASLRKRDVQQCNKPTRKRISLSSFSLAPERKGWSGGEGRRPYCNNINKSTFTAQDNVITVANATPPPRKAATSPAGGRFFSKSHCFATCILTKQQCCLYKSPLRGIRGRAFTAQETGSSTALRDRLRHLTICIITSLYEY